MFGCDGCAGEGAFEVKLESHSKDKKGNPQTTTLAMVTYPGEAAVPLLGLFPASMPPPPSATAKPA